MKTSSEILKACHFAAIVPHQWLLRQHLCFARPRTHPFPQSHALQLDSFPKAAQSWKGNRLGRTFNEDPCVTTFCERSVRASGLLVAIAIRLLIAISRFTMGCCVKSSRSHVHSLFTFLSPHQLVPQDMNTGNQAPMELWWFPGPYQNPFPTRPWLLLARIASHTIAYDGKCSSWH